VIEGVVVMIAAGCLVLSACEAFQTGGKTLQEFEEPPPAGTIAGDMIKPKTTESAEAMKKITAQIDLDRMKANSSTADEFQLGLYYSHKAAELQYLKDQLESSQPISKQQLSEALDNKGALEYGGYP
jgi:hypothetical protein